MSRKPKWVSQKYNQYILYGYTILPLRKQTPYFLNPDAVYPLEDRYHTIAHSDFLLSVYPKDKQTSMRSENFFLKMHPHLSNKLLSWKPSKVGEGCQTSFSNHIWHGIKCLPSFSGHEALKKNSVQVESLTKRKLGLRSNHSCPSGLRLFLFVFLELSRERLTIFFCLQLLHMESQNLQGTQQLAGLSLYLSQKFLQYYSD